MMFLHETVDNAAWVYKTDCEGIPSLEAGGRKTKEEEAYSNCLQMEIQCSAHSEEVDSLSTSTKRQRAVHIDKSGQGTKDTEESTMDEESNKCPNKTAKGRIEKCYCYSNRSVKDRWGRNKIRVKV